LLFLGKQQAQREISHGDAPGAIAGTEHSAMREKQKSNGDIAFAVWAVIMLVVRLYCLSHWEWRH
jgi:hypothetical protein